MTGLPVTPLQPTGDWRPDHGVPCGSCKIVARLEVCPSCHHALMANWRYSTTTCIALAGARDSGKSIYIGVLVKQVERWCERYGQMFLAMGETTATNYRLLYESVLFETRGLISPTPSARTGGPDREPLIFQMGVVDGAPHMLVLRDVAGEDLENTSSEPAMFRFFGNADLVMFLFDPMKIGEVTDQLQGVLPPQRINGADPAFVLNNLVRLMRGGTAVDMEKLRTPLALCVSKFDVLAELASVDGSPLETIMDNRGAAYNRDPGLDRQLDEQDLTLLAAEVESLLHKLHARGLLNLVDNYFQTHRTFAVSALGEHPFNDTRLSVRGIAPFRVLDPLRWAMWSLRYSTLTP